MSGFKPYPAYKDSGVEWLGEMPEHWVVKQLRYLGRFRKGLTITKADLTDTGIPCLNYGEVHSLYPFEVNQDIHPLKNVPAEYLETDPSACVVYGDFVFADTSEDLDGVGNFTHVSGMDPLFAGYHTIIYSLNSEVSSRFLAYCLDSFAFRTQLRMGVKGVKVFSVTQEILRGGISWLPTTAEQTQIARFLDHETARIDALIEEQQRLIELLKEKRQAVISHAVTKGLDPTVPMKDSGVEWLGEVPAHWSVSPLKFLVDEKVAGPYGASLTKAMYTDSGYRVYGQQQVISDDFSIGDYYISEEKFSEMQRYVVFPGDVLISVMGTIGRVSVVPVGVEVGIINPRLVRYKFAQRKVVPEFVKILLMSLRYQSRLREESQGSTMEGLNMAILGDLPLVLPSLDEQLSIVAFVEAYDFAFNELVGQAESAVGLLQERRSALISAAVTGKIDVRNW